MLQLASAMSLIIQVALLGSLNRSIFGEGMWGREGGGGGEGREVEG